MLALTLGAKFINVVHGNYRFHLFPRPAKKATMARFVDHALGFWLHETSGTYPHQRLIMIDVTLRGKQKL
jgi:thiosulfate reductase cytochrome b subunit